jgi:hypothetical protein
MASDNQSPTFMLLFRGTDWHADMSATEIQQGVQAMMDWMARLAEEGKFISAQPLEFAGMRVSMRNNAVAVDGPFAESKEAIGGYTMVKAPDIDAAVAIARQCPMLKHGVTVEVRQVATSCPVAKAHSMHVEMAEVMA